MSAAAKPLVLVVGHSANHEVQIARQVVRTAEVLLEPRARGQRESGGQLDEVRMARGQIDLLEAPAAIHVGGTESKYDEMKICPSTTVTHSHRVNAKS
ncbi:hypothetical protein INH39_00875 [Massilia violaceinigra]|uniref:Uncharacterized protein n=1 Tax=Massilia violaceinigra TaxID=2045208 RepID=A0ABY4A6P1_9BURK|nr:hypothetical protein [Massilia violaceinigra]UOD30343.1 hypothetical protein INH39_00875 [Massilia violaceinigra]